MFMYIGTSLIPIELDDKYPKTLRSGKIVFGTDVIVTVLKRDYI